MKRSGLYAALIGVSALGACAAPPVAVMADGTPVVGRAFTPTPRDGAVTLECVLMQNGALSDCVVVVEDPPGQGFGQTALAATRQARMTPQPDRVGQKVRFTTRFRRDD